MKILRRLFKRDKPQLTRSELFNLIETEATRAIVGQITKEKHAEMGRLDKIDPITYEMIIDVLENVIPERKVINMGWRSVLK